MFVVYVKPYGSPRRPMGHFKSLDAAKADAERVYAAFPSDEVVIAEEADNGRQNFVDAPERSALIAAAPQRPDIEVERLAPAGNGGEA